MIYKKGGINFIKSTVLPFFNSSGEKESLNARNCFSMLEEMWPTIGPKDRFARRLKFNLSTDKIHSDKIMRRTGKAQQTSFSDPPHLTPLDCSHQKCDDVHRF